MSGCSLNVAVNMYHLKLADLQWESGRTLMIGLGKRREDPRTLANVGTLGDVRHGDQWIGGNRRRLRDTHNRSDLVLGQTKIEQRRGNSNTSGPMDIGYVDRNAKRCFSCGTLSHFARDWMKGKGKGQ